MEWYWWIETDKCQERLKKRANSIFKDKTEAEEAMEYACKQVIEQCQDGELVMESIPNDASTLTDRHKAFLLTVLANRMRDWRDIRYGHQHTPQWIRDQTCKVLWNEAFTQLCIMKRLIVEVFEVLKQQQEFLKEFLKQQQQHPNEKYTSKKLDDMVSQQCEGQNLDVMVREILHRVRGCRKPNIVFIPLDDGNENTIIDTIPDPKGGIEDKLKRQCKEAVLTWWNLLLEQDDAIPPPISKTCIQGLNLHLTDRQLIVLRLLGRSNLTIEKVAKNIGLTIEEVAKKLSLTIKDVNKPGLTVWEMSKKLNLTVEEIANKLDLTNEEAVKKRSLTIEEIAKKLNLTVEETANELGLTIEELTKNLSLTVEETANKFGLPVEELVKNLGLTIKEADDKLRLTIQETADKLNLTIERLVRRLGLTVEKADSKLGLTVKELAEKLDSSVQSIKRKLDLTEVEKLRLTGLTIEEVAARLNLTEDQVRYAKEQALTAIRKALQKIDIDNMQDIEH